MLKISITEAKKNFSKYIAMVENDKEKVIITRYGKDVAQISCYEDNKTKRLGAAKGSLDEKPFSLEDVDGEIAKSFGY